MSKRKSEQPPITAHFKSNAPPSLLKWQTAPSGLLHGSYPHPKSDNTPTTIKAACFDMDGTLITTRGPHTFPKSEYDWQWLNKDVPQTLRDYHAKYYHLVIFTNQLNLMSRKSGPGMIKRKLERMVNEINCPVEVFIAVEQDHFRKPGTGMFDYYKQIIERRGQKIDMTESFYVGDAAGRANDHSNADKEMAKRAKLKFAVPENFFVTEPKFN